MTIECYTLASLDHKLKIADRGVSREEWRKLKELIKAFDLDAKAIRNADKEQTGDRWGLSFRAFRKVYQDCPLLLTFEKLGGIEHQKQQPLREVLIDYSHRLYLPLFEQVATYLRLLHQHEPVQRPIGMILPGYSGGGYILHEDGSFCERAAICWPRKKLEGRPWPNLYLQTFNDFLKTLKTRWHPALHADSHACTTESGPPIVFAANAVITRLIRETKVSQRRLANVLEVSDSFVSQLLKGIKPWPAEKFQAAKVFLEKERTHQCLHTQF